MQNNFISRITGSIRLVILLFLILIIIIAKSKYLLMFLTTLTIILMILTKKSVNVYIKSIKKIVFLLLFVLFICIIVYDNIGIFYLISYKILLILFIIKICYLNFSFFDLHSAIYTLIKPLNCFNVDLKRISYDISIYILFFAILLKSGDLIKSNQCSQKRKSYGIKKYILPRLFLSIDKIHEFEDNLKLKFYNLKLEKINYTSLIMLILVVMLFISVVFKEVIL